MKEMNAYTKWTLHHTWVVTASYFTGMFVLLLIHGAFGFTMKEDGTYLSNTLMHLGSGIILASGTGILQRELLKKYFRVSFSWVWALIAGFVLAELIAGIVLWKLEVYRGLINLFNTNYHLPEAAIFALAGLLAGILQCSLLNGSYKKSGYWIVASSLGWGGFILSAYLGVYAIIAGALLYGAITGFVFDRVLKSKNEK